MEDEFVTIPDIVAGFSVHAMARDFPPMPQDGFEELKASLKTHGQKEPVRVWHNSIVDGAHRALALEQLKREPEVDNLDCSEAEAIRLTFILNAQRRHLTTAQKAFAVYDHEKRLRSALASTTLPKGRKKPRKPTRAELAERAGTTPRTVQKVAAIHRHAIPDVMNAARTGHISIDDALLISGMPIDEQYPAFQELISQDRKIERVAARESSLTERFDASMDFLLGEYRSFADVLPIMERDPVSFVNELGDMIKILEGIRSEALATTAAATRAA